MAPPVIVVGSGLAGLSAASQLISHNIPVQLLEQASKPGGNSIKASSGINAAPTKFQPVSNDDQFYNDTVKSAGNVLADAKGEDRALREQLMSAVTRSSAEALYWLTDNNSIDLSKVAQLGGHTYPRTHRGGAGQKPPGASIVGTLLNSLGGNSLFTLKTDSKVTKILRDGDEVVGVEVEYTAAENTRKETLYGPVIFATGGFAGDSHGLLAKYRPDLAGFPSTNDARQGSQPLLVNVGAALVDMEYVQVHPTGFIDPQEPSALVKFLAAEMLRGEGGVLLSTDGNRFVNELDTREKVTDAIMNLATPLDTPTRQWDVTIVLDEGAAIAASSHMGFYQWKGLTRKTTISNLGESALQTFQEYAEVVSGEKPDPFGRKYFGHWNLREVTGDTVMYIGKVTPVVHFTMGGVRFNERAQVLGVEGLPIQGLWAAGEITGGLHGRNRLAGSSLLECVVFGRIAGDEAATFYKRKFIKSA